MIENFKILRHFETPTDLNPTDPTVVFHWLSVLLDQQRQLDEIRLTGSHNGMKEVKDLLAATAKALCDTQEVIRALTAMG